MKETIMNLLTYLALAGAAAAMAWALKNRKQQIKSSLVSLIQQAETAIQGVGLGSEKKAWVMEQLELIEGKIPEWVDSAIDQLVTVLNEKDAWLTNKASETASGALDTITGGGDTDG